MKIFDTHAHYSDVIYDEDRYELFKNMFNSGVSDIVLIGASLNESKKEKLLVEKYNGDSLVPNLYYTVGDHPDEIPKFSPDSNEGIEHLEKLESICRDDKGKIKSLAIGEIGLDYYGESKNDDDYKNQAKWFIAEINLAKRLDLPIVVHSRDACEDTLNLMKTYAKNMSAIIHCFSYEKEIAIEYEKLGYHIGIGGTLTFKNARKVKEAVKALSLESIVTETDAPYLSPTPYRGKRNESDYIKFVIEEIARIKNIDIDIVSDVLYNNALEVYGL